MKRYMEIQEIRGRMMLAYFRYSQIKYGSKGYSEARLGRLSAYKSIMNLYRPLADTNQRIKSQEVFWRFDLLREKAEALSDDGFRRAFLETLEQSDPRRHLQEC
jgi:hypothetical protein